MYQMEIAMANVEGLKGALGLINHDNKKIVSTISLGNRVVFITEETEVPRKRKAGDKECTATAV